MNSETGRSFEDLVVYQRALKFVMSIYGLTSLFPEDNVPNLVLRVKESAMSITARISDSARKKSIEEKRRSFKIALESVEDCQMYLSLTMEYENVNTTELTRELTAVQTLINELLEQL